MSKYVIRRLLQSIPIFFGITILSYSIIVLAPGDPVSIMTFDPGVSQADRAALAERLGVNDPLPMQYVRWLIGDDWKVVETIDWYQIRTDEGVEGWLSEDMAYLDEETGELSLLATRQPLRLAPSMDSDPSDRVGRRATMELLDKISVDVRGDNKGILRGDFGNSFQHKSSPLKLIWERFPASFELNIAVILVGLVIGWLIGILAAVWRGSAFDQFSRVLAVIGDAVPVFWLSFLVLLAFGAPGLDIFPMGSRCDPIRDAAGQLACPPIWMRLEYMFLPTLVLSLNGISAWSRYIRAAMLDTISSDYIRTAKAKGLHPRSIWFNHALRNALIPMATFLGPTLVAFYGGAVVIEQIFAWPGMGRLLLQAALSQDYPLVMASVVVGSILTIVGYLISDILYALFDPRIRLS